MNIIGIGIDVTDLPRIAQMLQRYGDRFLRRVFTEREIAYCTRRRNPVPHLAGRFAVKEAAMKALGTGHAFGVLWKDVEVVRRGGPPQLQLHGGAAARADGHARAPEPRHHHPRGNRGNRTGHAARRLRARRAASLACRLPFPRSLTARPGPRQRAFHKHLPFNQIHEHHRRGPGRLPACGVSRRTSRAALAAAHHRETP